MKSALTYPIVVLVIAFIAVIVMSVFVLPKFTGLYKSLGARLPLPTRMLIGFTNFMTSYWPLVLGGTGLIVGRRSSPSSAASGARVAETSLAMKLPVVGNLFHLISLERFCRVLALCPLPACPCRSRSGSPPTAPTTHSSRPRWSTVAKRWFAVAGSTSPWPRRACSRSPLGR